MADLKEQQRELLMATMFQRNTRLEMLVPQQLTDVMRAVLCHPKSSIENPSWGQQSSGQRSFLVIQQGECFGASGYWVEGKYDWRGRISRRISGHLLGSR
eukprot:6121547-Amphidinium_carterae.2